MTNIAYVDGSAIGQNGGWAYRVGQKVRGSGFRLTKENDSYEAELMAVYKCLEESEGKVSIVCDHQPIVAELRRIKDDDWVAPDCHKALWLRVRYEAMHKLDDASWAKGYTTTEQKEVHNVANNYARTR